MPRPAGRPLVITPRFRLELDPGTAFGPGKAELLERIALTHSISEAARGMGMAYMTAWSHVRSLNRAPGGPFVTAMRGGPQRGGASLTPAGEKLLLLYRELETKTAAAVRPTSAKLTRLLRP